MRISIVTLSYNQRTFLREAIDSVLQQDHPDLEYIVVDPGSTDGSREFIRSYGEQVAQVVFEPDQGAADGLNKGFSRATGEVFGFLNADDYLLPGRPAPGCGVFPVSSAMRYCHGKWTYCWRRRAGICAM